MLKLMNRLGWGALAALLAVQARAQEAVGTAADEAVAEAVAATVDKGDTAWMMISTILVLLMILPGLALFYGGLVRAKNMLSVLMQCFVIACVMMIIWVVYGYSLALNGGGGLDAFIGGFSQGCSSSGVTPDSTVATFSEGVEIPEFIFICFQMTFACITPALIVGGFAERMKFSAVLLFCDPLGRPSSTSRSRTWSGTPTAICSPGARSTSPAAPSCTSTPASRRWSAPS